MIISSDWQLALRDITRLAVAYVLALPVGWYRERQAHTIGLRTFPLVATASCAYVLLSMPGSQPDPAAQSRIIQGLVAGIGFIGGGAILKAEGGVVGTATAASIWNTGALGAAVAQERYVLAFVLSVLNLVSLRVLLPLKLYLDGKQGRDPEAGPK
ncbi:MAG: MgtC/SapB family protein [Acidobacteriia bacterium]|nr:MgtC/SapB family protein [Terriglobia bacterium]